MTASPAPTPAEQVLEILADLHALIDARMQANVSLAGIFFYIFGRLTRLRDHLIHLVARIRAGKAARPPRPPLTGDAAIIAAQKSRKRHRSPIQWPKQFGGLADMLSRAEAADFAARLQALLASADIVAAIIEHPALGRILRPLCHSLGVRLIPELRLKRRKRTRKPKPPPAAPLPDPTRPPPHLTGPGHHFIPPPVEFFPSEDDPPMAERVERHLARHGRREW